MVRVIVMPGRYNLESTPGQEAGIASSLLRQNASRRGLTWSALQGAVWASGSTRPSTPTHRHPTSRRSTSMSDIIDILAAAAVIAIVAAPPIVLARLLGGSEHGSLADLVAFRSELPWPRGVQEPDAPAWNLEILGRDAATSRIVPPDAAARLHPCPSPTPGRVPTRPASPVSRSCSAPAR